MNFKILSITCCGILFICFSGNNRALGKLCPQAKPIPADMNPQTDEPSAAEVCGVFGVAEANFKAWKTGDVLIRNISSFDSVNRGSIYRETGVLVNSENWYRVTFDFQSKKFRVLLARQRDVLNLSLVTAEENGHCIQQEFRGYLASSETGQLTMKVFPNAGGSRTWDFVNGDDAQLLNWISFPEMRSIGLSPYWPITPMAQVERLYARFKSGDALMNSPSYKAGKLKLKMSLREEGNDTFSVAEYQFDSENNMPISYKGYAEGPGSLPGQRAVANGTTADFEWKDEEGIPVPLSIRATKNDTFDLDGKPEYGTTTQRVDFHWFSFNKELDSEAFDANCMSDIQLFRALLDPEKTEADTLIEKKRPPESNPDGLHQNSILGQFDRR